ncbi:hypothetical protein BACCAP_04745 [Pseudoflavonifractor capillosus ATCC 29799]|uniref:Uncharacterized protein n=1 Tax=Pseudoflavonifractor capillosus ATCC 29799 TaxID=411467 RepID=A6P2L3_9FIRM|nr:hypothetical protein BACCAP_04745 [Pseudoflavonifractor capillosus ATCC 29799]
MQGKSPRQSFTARRRRNQMEICFFRGHAPRKKHFSACKRARFARAAQQAASSLKNACIFEKRKWARARKIFSCHRRSMPL